MFCENSSSDDNEPISLDDRSNTVLESKESMIEEIYPKDISVGAFVVVKFNARDHFRHYVVLTNKAGGSNE